jgi:predicted N-acyltransferase
MMKSVVHKSIDELNAREWNALGADRNPFLRHEFFAALEHTGCIGLQTGWDPCYFTLKDSQGLAAAVPAFRKAHSYGEFVFDFAWAQAYSRFGSRYYPKLTVAVPFTPATGPRLLVRADLDPPSPNDCSPISRPTPRVTRFPRCMRCLSMSLLAWPVSRPAG